MDRVHWEDVTAEFSAILGLESLGMTLNNLGSFPSDLGRREQALQAAEEAVEIYRRLAAGNPQAFEPDLALALWTFGWVRAIARAELNEGLAATNQAIEILNQWQVALPGIFVGRIRSAKSTAADLLDQLGRRGEAEAIREQLKDDDDPASETSKQSG